MISSSQVFTIKKVLDHGPNDVGFCALEVVDEFGVDVPVKVQNGLSLLLVGHQSSVNSLGTIVVTF